MSLGVSPRKFQANSFSDPFRDQNFIFFIDALSEKYVNNVNANDIDVPIKSTDKDLNKNFIL